MFTSYSMSLTFLVISFLMGFVIGFLSGRLRHGEHFHGTRILWISCTAGCTFLLLLIAAGWADLHFNLLPFLGSALVPLAVPKSALKRHD